MRSICWRSKSAVTLARAAAWAWWRAARHTQPPRGRALFASSFGHYSSVAMRFGAQQQAETQRGLSRLALALALFLFVATAVVRAVPLMEPKSLEHFSKPGPYHMGTMMIDAPKASIFRQSYGYAPIAVYFPTNAPGSGVLATNETTFPAIGFAHGAGSAAEFYTGLYAHVVSHGFIIVSVRNMAPIPATLGDDMCHGLAWIITEALGGGLYKQESMFYGRVDPDRVGVMGKPDRKPSAPPSLSPLSLSLSPPSLFGAARGNAPLIFCDLAF